MKWYDQEKCECSLSISTAFQGVHALILEAALECCIFVDLASLNPFPLTSGNHKQPVLKPTSTALSGTEGVTHRFKDQLLCCQYLHLQTFVSLYVILHAMRCAVLLNTRHIWSDPVLIHCNRALR